MDQQHHHSCQDASTASVLPKAAEEIWHATSGPLQILSLHHREHPDRLNHGLVCEMLCPRPQGLPSGGEDGLVHHWDRAPTHPRHLLKKVPEEGMQHRQGTHTPATSCSLPYSQADSIGA